MNRAGLEKPRILTLIMQLSLRNHKSLWLESSFNVICSNCSSGPAGGCLALLSCSSGGIGRGLRHLPLTFKMRTRFNPNLNSGAQAAGNKLQMWKTLDTQMRLTVECIIKQPGVVCLEMIDNKGEKQPAYS